MRHAWRHLARAARLSRSEPPPQESSSKHERLPRGPKPKTSDVMKIPAPESSSAHPPRYRDDMPSRHRFADRPRPTALARAEHGGPPVRLNAKEKTLLNEALRRGEDLGEQVESAVVSYGRWLLGAVFDDDAAAALDARSKNPVWIELVRRAGGPTLRVSRHVLYVALSVAAHDKRITDQAWRALDAGRKELLLPLTTDDRLRAAAQHVSKFNLTQASTKQYVTELLGAEGRARQIRITAPQLVARVRKLRAGLEKSAVLRRIGDLGRDLTPAEREKVAGEVERLKEVLSDVAKAVRGKR